MHPVWAALVAVSLSTIAKMILDPDGSIPIVVIPSRPGGIVVRSERNRAFSAAHPFRKRRSWRRVWWLHDGNRLPVACNLKNQPAFFDRTYLLDAMSFELADAYPPNIHRFILIR